MNSRICPRLAPMLRPAGLTQALTITLFALVMSACGSSGGSSKSAVSEVPSRAINAGNAESVAKLTLEMMDITDVVTSTFGLGAGDNSEVCESGSGIGTVTDCVIGTNTLNGAVSATITDTDSVLVPGEGAARDMPTKMSLAVNNLDWQSTLNATTYSVSGNLLATYKYPALVNSNGSATVTGTLTLTDTQSNTRYQFRSLTQRYSFSDDASGDGYAFNHSDQEGNMVYMDENTQYTVNGGNILEALSVIGDNSRLALRYSDASPDYQLDIDADNDGNYDVFTSVPRTELGRDHSQSASAPTVTVARQGGNSAPVKQNIGATLTATATDADYNLLTFSWAVTSAPTGVAEADRAALLKTVNQRTSNVTFKSAVPGDYVVTVTVTEVNTSNPKTVTAQISLSVDFDPPLFSITDLDGATGAVGVNQTFDIQPQSAQGTISVELLAAPAGMTLAWNPSQNIYQLSWTPQTQFFAGITEKVVVKMANEDHDTVNTFNVTVGGSGNPLITPGLRLNGYSSGATLANVDSDAKGELLIAGKDSLFAGISLDGAGPDLSMANPYQLDTSAANLSGIKPLRTNGVLAAYVAISERGVFLINKDSLQVETSRALQFNLTALTSKRRFDVADLDGDGNDEIIVLTKTVNSSLKDQLFVLNQDLTTRASTAQGNLGQEFLIGNVDTDSHLEIVCGNGIVLDGTTLATKVAEGTLFGDHNYTLADVDADGRDEIIEVDSSTLRVFDADTLTTTAISFSLNADNLNLFGLNADSDAAEELVVGDDDNVMHIFSIDTSAPSATLDRSVGTSVATSYVVDVLRGDVTGDSAEELVMVARRDNGAPLISVAALNSTALLIDGSTAVVLTGNFASARAIDTTASSSIATASSQTGGASTIRTLSVADTGTPIVSSPLFDASAALYAVAADVDNNDVLDIVSNGVPNGGGDAVVAAGAPGLSPWQLPISAGTPAPLTTAQIDGSGNLDAVFIERSGTLGSETLDLVVQTVGGSELARTTLSTGFVLAAPIAIAVANLDGDGNPDIVVLDESSLRSFEYSAGTLTAQSSASLSTTAAALATADIDNDGRDEIALARSGLDNVIEIYSGALVLVTQVTRTETTSALAFYTPAGERPLLLAGSGSNGNLNNHIAALDAASLTEAWSSPVLNGSVNTIQVMRRDSGDQLQIGTSAALYRAQR